MVVVHRCEHVSYSETGTPLRIRVVARQDDLGRWFGFIEFHAPDGGRALRTNVETVQPNWTDLEYWATGLSAAYMQGAYDRAQLRAEASAHP